MVLCRDPSKQPLNIVVFLNIDHQTSELINSFRANATTPVFQNRFQNHHSEFRCFPLDLTQTCSIFFLIQCWNERMFFSEGIIEKEEKPAL